MRKVLAIDGTFFNKHVWWYSLLTAVGQDTENHIYSVAFCVVDKKCDNT